MNINLVPNIENADKYIKYFIKSAGKAAVEQARNGNHILVEGDIPVVDVKVDVSKKIKQPVQIISEPEDAANKAEKVVDDLESTKGGVKRKHSQSDADNGGGKRSGKKSSRSGKFLEFGDFYGSLA